MSSAVAVMAVALCCVVSSDSVRLPRLYGRCSLKSLCPLAYSGWLPVWMGGAESDKSVGKDEVGKATDDAP